MSRERVLFFAFETVNMTKKELGQIVGGLFVFGVIVWAVSYALSVI